MHTAAVPKKGRDKAGIPADLVRDEATHLREELARSDHDLRALKENPPAGVQTTAREVEEFLTSFEVVFAADKPPSANAWSAPSSSASI